MEETFEEEKERNFKEEEVLTFEKRTTANFFKLFQIFTIFCQEITKLINICGFDENN